MGRVCEVAHHNFRIREMLSLIQLIQQCPSAAVRGRPFRYSPPNRWALGMWPFLTLWQDLVNLKADKTLELSINMKLLLIKMKQWSHCM